MLPFNKKEIIAVDISDHSIELLLLTGAGKLLTARVLLADGVIAGGEVIDRQKAAEYLREALAKLNLPEHVGGRPAVASLPDSRSYIYCFELPLGLEGEELEARIVEKVRGAIPADFAELTWDYLVRLEKNFQAVLFAAAPRALVDDYRQLFADAGLALQLLDVESLSLGRALLGSTQEHQLVLDIGHHSTNLAFFDDQGVLRLAASLPIAGASLTAAIAEALALPASEAEEQKKLWGLKPAAKNQVADAIESKLKIVIKGVLQAINYYEKKHERRLESIILTGGSAAMIGLGPYLSKQLLKEVELGSPLARFGALSASIEGNQALLYANVVGLALLSRDNKMPHLNLAKTDVEAAAAWQAGADLRLNQRKLLSAVRQSLAFGISFALISLVLLAIVIYQQLALNRQLPMNKAETMLPAVEEPVAEVQFQATSTPTETVSSSASTTVAVAEATSSADVIALPPQSTSSAELGRPAKPALAEVLETPTGWLNVRSGPGTSFNSIAKINPGENYLVLEEQGEWYKLELDAELVGWASAKYLRRK